MSNEASAEMSRLQKTLFENLLLFDKLSLKGYRTASPSPMANEEGGILSSKALSSQVRCVNRSRSRPRCLDSMNRTSSSRHAKISQHPPPRLAVRASIR